MPKRKNPEDEMAVVWDGLVPIIGEPGSDDEVASTYDAFVQNDVGRESLRKIKNAHDGYFRRVRKRQRLQRPAASSTSGGTETAAGSSQEAMEVVEVEEVVEAGTEVALEDARALIDERREGRGEVVTQEEEDERKWQREQQLKAMARQRKFEAGDFSDFRHVETPSTSTSASSSRVNTASQSTPRPRKAAIKARNDIAAASKSIQPLMNFRLSTPTHTKDGLARKLTRQLPVEKPATSLPPPLQGKKAVRSYANVVEAVAEKSVGRLMEVQERSVEVVVGSDVRRIKEKEKSLREIIREEVSTALRASQEATVEEKKERRDEYEEGFLRFSPSGKQYWEPKEGPQRRVWSPKWTPSPSPTRPSRRSSLPASRRSPLPPSRRPTSRPDRREDRSAHSTDRRHGGRPSRQLPRRSPSPASHRPRDASRMFRGERDAHRRRAASPMDRSRPRRASPAPSSSRSSTASSRPGQRSWRKERSSK